MSTTRPTDKPTLSRKFFDDINAETVKNWSTEDVSINPNGIKKHILIYIHIGTDSSFSAEELMSMAEDFARRQYGFHVILDYNDELVYQRWVQGHKPLLAMFANNLISMPDQRNLTAWQGQYHTCYNHVSYKIQLDPDLLSEDLDNHKDLLRSSSSENKDLQVAVHDLVARDLTDYYQLLGICKTLAMHAQENIQFFLLSRVSLTKAAANIIINTLLPEDAGSHYAALTFILPEFNLPRVLDAAPISASSEVLLDTVISSSVGMLTNGETTTNVLKYLERVVDKTLANSQSQRFGSPPKTAYNHPSNPNAQIELKTPSPDLVPYRSGATSTTTSPKSAQTTSVRRLLNDDDDDVSASRSDDSSEHKDAGNCSRQPRKMTT